ncbi:GPI mannosyltransferase 4-like [Ptychodera flava]|uniref:GPI mannosyltransferase 4-like n=1 Tax=Ptychodera flava TaxID=63121 RepID=UPI00396AAA60
MDQMWYVLVAFRFLLTLYPQSGYIHPDEFFQNPEVTAASVFGFETHKTWEWQNKELPIRTVVFPYATSGFAFLVLKKLQEYFPGIVTAYSLLVFPRLLLTFLSLILDYMLYKLCRYLRIDADRCLVFLASSYVTLVFCCRTFSNGMECFLFAVVLALTLKSAETMEKSKVSQRGRKLSRKEDPVTTSRETYSFLLSVVITFGMFTRLSFAAFVMWPMFYWYYSIVRYHGFLVGFSSAFSLIPGTVLTMFTCIVTDSIYYGTMSSDVIFSYDIQYFYDTFTSDHLPENLTITPLNFLIYNSDISKLSYNPIHPRSTHFVLNMPLLFLPLLMWVLPSLFSFNQIPQQSGKSPTINKMNFFLVLATLVPVGALSFIPHQEPRFLIPIIVPLLLLFCRNVDDLSFNFKVSWIIWNLMGVLFFGFFHQGGVVPCLQHLQGLSKSNPQTEHHFVFYHTYMPPRHLLAVSQASDSHIIRPSDNENAPFSHVTTHDLAGADHAFLSQKIDQLMTQAHRSQTDVEVYIISPSTLSAFFHTVHAQYDFNLQRQFYPHITIEDPMDFSFDDKYAVDKSASTFMKFVQSQLSLNLYKVEQRWHDAS